MTEIVRLSSSNERRKTLFMRADTIANFSGIGPSSTDVSEKDYLVVGDHVNNGRFWLFTFASLKL